MHSIKVGSTYGKYFSVVHGAFCESSFLESRPIQSCKKAITHLRSERISFVLVMLRVRVDLNIYIPRRQRLRLQGFGGVVLACMFMTSNVGSQSLPRRLPSLHSPRNAVTGHLGGRILLQPNPLSAFKTASHHSHHQQDNNNVFDHKRRRCN
jgi:hypothetical protein